MPTYTKEDIVYRTCLVLTRHIRNQVEENRNGNHTRIFSHLLHPEIDFVYLGKSTKVTPETNTHPEHVVPCAVLLLETRRLIEESKIRDDEIAKLLQKHWKIAIITKEEANILDRDLGYKSIMPIGWSFEHGDTMARLKEGNITLV